VFGPAVIKCSTSHGCLHRNTGSMSTSEMLDVARVRTVQVRGHQGLRVDLLTNHPAENLIRGEFPEPSLSGVVRENGNLTDLVSTFWAAVFLVSDHFKATLEKYQLSGWRTIPVSLSSSVDVGTLWLLTVHGTCGHLYGTDGYAIPGVHVGNFLDPAQWDGSDIFLADNHSAIFVTPRCADTLQAVGLANLELRNEGLEPLIRK
jgi:hypothetical protein